MRPGAPTVATNFSGVAVALTVAVALLAPTAGVQVPGLSYEAVEPILSAGLSVKVLPARETNTLRVSGGMVPDFDTFPALEGAAVEVVRELESAAGAPVVVITREIIKPKQAESKVLPDVVEAKERADVVLAEATVEAQAAVEAAEKVGVLVETPGSLPNVTIPEPFVKSDRERADEDVALAESKVEEATEAKVEATAELASQVLAAELGVADAVVLVDPTPEQVEAVKSEIAAAEEADRVDVAAAELAAARKVLEEAVEVLNDTRAESREVLDGSEGRVLDNTPREALLSALELPNVTVPTSGEGANSSSLRAEILAVIAATKVATDYVPTLAAPTQAVVDAQIAWEVEQERLAAEQRAREEAERAALAKARASYRNGYLPASDLTTTDFSRGQLFRKDAATALVQLNEAYRARFGRNLFVTSGYRTFDQQVSVKASRGFWAATPGHSNHGLGLAVDLGNVGTFGSEQYKWLDENAAAFGWQNPPGLRQGDSKPEPWHWEYFAGM